MIGSHYVGKEFMKEMYLRLTKGLNRRDESHGRHKDWVKEYMSEIGSGREGVLQHVKECLKSVRWRLWPSLERLRHQRLEQIARCEQCTSAAAFTVHYQS